MTKRRSVFVSYSWDSIEHKEWVINFTNKLRAAGIDATIDVFETQKGTTNLYSMMVNNIKIKDSVILILSSNYAKKADELEGGVGFETEMLLPLIMSNKNKIIPIIKNNNKEKPIIPFYLEGINYIDFSDDNKFAEKFEELKHRILEIPLYTVAELGEIPNLKSKNLEETDSDNLDDFSKLIPNFKQITDLDKNRFMKKSFEEIKNFFIVLLKNTKNRNSNFDYEYEDITSKKTIFKLYLDGNLKYSIKMWSASNYGNIENINFLYGNIISYEDNSMNEIVKCELDEDNNLKLRMTMNIRSNKKPSTAKDVAIEIWENSLTWIR